MRLPAVTFTEESIGISPVRAGVRNRIGIIGEFSRGPANVFSYLGGPTDFANRYGSDLKPASVAVQVAYENLAEHVSVIRVLGNSRPAKAQASIGGYATKANTLKLLLRFIGNVVEADGTNLKVGILSSGEYTGSVSGRYHFKLTSITGNNATIKYTFLPLGASTNIDWNDVNTNFVLKLDVDKGATLAVANGVSLTFGTVGQTDNLAMTIGQEWTVRVNAYEYNIPVSEFATAAQVAGSIINTINYRDPIGSVVPTDDANGVVFSLDPNIITGSVGNKYSYYWELAEADKVVTASAAYAAGGADNDDQLTLSADDIALVQVGAAVTTTTADIIPSNVTVTAVDTINNTVTLSSDAIASSGGSTTFKFTNTLGLDITNLGVAASAYMTGGVDGPATAYRDFYGIDGTALLRLQAVSEGSWGNEIKVTLYPLDSSRIQLRIIDPNGKNFNPPLASETFIINLTETNNQGEFTALRASKYVRGLFIPKFLDPVNYNINLELLSPQRLAPADASESDPESPSHSLYYGPSKLVDVTLESGSDGPTVTDDDYVQAIKQLAGQPAHIILCPGKYSDTIRQALVAQAEASSELGGLQIAILSAKPQLTPEAAASETSGYNSKRAVMVAGWSTYVGQPNFPRFGLSPDSIYAGRLARIPYFSGPNARRSSGSISNITEVDTSYYGSLPQLQVYTDARLEVLGLDPSLQGFYFMNGLTTSSDTAWQKVSTRRTYDVLRMDLYENLQQYKSEPHTALLRQQVAASINGYLSQKSSAGHIRNYAKAIVNETNNTEDSYLLGKLNVIVRFLPLEAADYIEVSLIRDLDGQVTLL